MAGGTDEPTDEGRAEQLLAVEPANNTRYERFARPARVGPTIELGCRQLERELGPADDEGRG